MVEEVLDVIKDRRIITFDQKKNHVLLSKEGLVLNVDFDTMIAANLMFHSGTIPS